MMPQRNVIGRITIRYPRLILTFGWIVMLAGVVATFGIGYGIVWALFAAFPR